MEELVEENLINIGWCFLCGTCCPVEALTEVFIKKLLHPILSTVEARTILGNRLKNFRNGALQVCKDDTTEAESVQCNTNLMERLKVIHDQFDYIGIGG
jgi:hypothetical protein